MGEGRRVEVQVVAVGQGGRLALRLTRHTRLQAEPLAGWSLALS